MTSDRPYRAAQPFAEALEEIRRCSGNQFDPQVVAVMKSLAVEMEELRREALSKSLVSSPNHQSPGFTGR